MTLTKTGSGTQVLSGANTYTGPTTISGGVLTAANTAALPNFSSGTVSVAGGALLTLPAGGSGQWQAANIVTLLTNSNVSFQSGGTLGIDTTGGNVSYPSGITNTNMGLVKLGGNTLTLSTGNTYGGGTTVSGGTLALAAANNTLSASGAITVGVATLDLGGGSQTTTGAISLQSGGIIQNGTLVNNGTAYNLQGGTVNANLAGSAGLTQSIAGLATLNGANTNAGTTLASGGTLNFAAGSSLVNSTIVDAGSGGVLTISGSLTVAPNGAFGVGTGFSGGTGTVIVNSGAVLNIGGGSGGYAGRTYIGDKLDNTGTAGVGILTINGGIVNVAASGTGTTGDASRLLVQPVGWRRARPR